VAQRERPDSPAYVDAAVAAILAWQARCDALAEGVGVVRRSMYEDDAGEVDIEALVREQDAALERALKAQEATP
jgi:hypothetical protein